MALPLLLYTPFLLVLSIVLALAIRARRRSLKFLKGPPNPSILFGNDYDLSNQLVVGDLELKWFKQYGTAVRATTCYNQDMLVVCDPRALQHIFHKSTYKYRKSADTIQATYKLFGPGLATVQGSIHQRQRKILNPAFSATQMKPLVPVFQKIVNSLSIKWKEQLQSGAQVIDTTKWFPNMTLDVLGESVFEYDFGALESSNNQLADMVRNLFVDTTRPTPLNYLYRAFRRDLPSSLLQLTEIFPTKEDIRWKAWLNASQGEAKKLYERKMQGETSQDNDLLGVISRALRASDSEKQLNDEEALSQMATIILAGHETSANTLTWLFYQLARHPADQERLLKEIKQAREEKGDEDFTANDFESMPFLNAVIKETLRLHPIVSSLLREPEEDDVIPLANPVVSTSGEVLGEIPVVEGQRIMASITGYNYLKEVWGDDAEEWNPERHLDAKRQTTLGVYGNLMTFSAGIRSCIGWRFAVHEVQTVAVNLLQSFQFSMPKDVEIMMIQAGFAQPMVKGELHKGFQMPLQVRLRD
ncbi:cytochrome p450 [Moniliophthora roreri]|nr:cytochrome p450 [Moniliophthora roreri]